MIGAQIDILDSKNKTLTGLKGTIVDETRNTIRIQSGNRFRKIIKGQINSMLLTKGNTISKLDGLSTVGRQEDKIKK